MDAVILPLAISFFTFQQIAYLVDVHRGGSDGGSFYEYSLFVSFFPQLIAGPIVHHAEVMPQFADHETYKPQRRNMAAGAMLFAMGLFKKVVLADGVAEAANHAFSGASDLAAIGLVEAWAGALSYTLQIYFDFSGYMDMALGAALIINVRLPTNFDSPYKSRSVLEFWRRWHITLGRFFRNYVYIPLGGNRRGADRTLFNVMVVMVLSGFWHGANWTFVFWGLIHGLAMLVQLTWARNGLPSPAPLAGVLMTLLFVVFAWVPFRAESVSDSFNIWLAMCGLGVDNSLDGLASALVSPCALFVACLALPNSQQFMSGNGVVGFRRNWANLALLWALLLASAAKALSRPMTEFLYFNF